MFQTYEMIVLRKLVELARKADREKTAVFMSDVFDDPKDAAAWDWAWTEAKRLVDQS